MAVLGLDVGGTKIRAAVAEGAEILACETVPTPDSFPGFRRAVTALAERLQMRQGTAVQRVGVGIPGARLADETCWVPNLPYLTGHRLAADLSAWLGAPAAVENDAQLALLGECWLGAARGLQDVVLISIGTGIGGAILYGGRVCRGAHGGAGAFGWLQAGPGAPAEEPDTEGGHCVTFEGRAAGRALDQRSLTWRTGANGHELAAAVRAGDAKAAAVWRTWAKELADGIAALASALDPQVILVTGGLSGAFDLLSPAIEAAMQRRASPLVRQTPVAVAALGENAPLYGALRLAQTGGLERE
ncbi:ROK family protein [Alicyclobacillus sp.]|uniref:ROK family protein n=1 Tax=Alicyclobacillus sp. TaxID=61169 RepID=UPI0025BF1E55|nr:ROK family protein [Alicyclobacillus sp.]MCL6516046.1 ROK family protein [Alicyclobacillus sp.]